MNIPTFNNSALQDDSLGDAIDLTPDDITVAYESRLIKKYILIINDVRYGYEFEVDRDNDRNLAMALLLKSMQDAGVQIRALYRGSKVPVTIDKIKVDEHGLIYVVTTDKYDEYMNSNVTDLILDE